MGVKFAREYEEIITDLAQAMQDSENCYLCLEMEEVDWQALSPEEQMECIRTMADDVFYGLGSEPEIDLDACRVSYDKDKHLIKVSSSDQVVRVIRLI